MLAAPPFSCILTLLPGVVDGSALRAGDVLGYLADELLQGWNGGGAKVWTCNAYVGVEVGNGMLQAVGVVLDPLGGTDEAFFFGVPGTDDDGALWLPALLEEIAETVDGLQHGSGAAVGIDCAVDPGITMVAGGPPSRSRCCSGSVPSIGPDDVPDGAELGLSCSRCMWTVTLAAPEAPPR